MEGPIWRRAVVASCISTNLGVLSNSMTLHLLHNSRFPLGAANRYGMCHATILYILKQQLLACVAHGLGGSFVFPVGQLKRKPSNIPDSAKLQRT